MASEYKAPVAMETIQPVYDRGQTQGYDENQTKGYDHTQTPVYDHAFNAQQQQQQQPPQYPYQAHTQAAPVQQQAPATTPAPTGTVIPLANLGSSSAPVQCPNCHQRALTHVTLLTGNTTHAYAAILCLISCCCVPYCVSGTKDCEHKCGNCGVRLATWHRSGRTDVHAF